MERSLYISEEESEQNQVEENGSGLKAGKPVFVPETNLENILHEIERMKPSRLI